MTTTEADGARRKELRESGVEVLLESVESGKYLPPEAAKSRIRNLIASLEARVDRLEGVLEDIDNMSYSSHSYRMYANTPREEPVIAENVLGDVNLAARQALDSEEG